MNLVTYIIIVVIFSVITFYSYYLDKTRAKKQQWRIPTKSLILMSFLFGSVGGLFSIYFLNYKEKRIIILNYIAFLLHILLGIFIYITFDL